MNPRSATCLLLTFLTGMAAPAHAAEEFENPAARYLPPVVTDAYNPDVQEGLLPPSEPRRGGRLRLRTPAQYQHLNVITVTGQPERVILNHMTDSLVDIDSTTLEYYGEMAWHWRQADLVKKPGEEPTEGRIIARSDDTVTFVPGAWELTFNRFDVEEYSRDEGWLRLTPQWGGETIRGRLIPLQHTIRIDQGFESPLADEAITIPNADIDTYVFEIGELREERPFAKEGTAFEFHIRPGVTWQDGAPFTAHDVKFSFDTIMNSSVDAQHKRAYYAEVTKCEVLDDLTVRFHYGKTYFQALAFLGGINGSTYFVPRHIFRPEQFGGDERAFGTAFNNSDFKERPVYTGPYKLKEWRRGDSLTIERHEDYWKNKLEPGAVPLWEPGQPYMDEISWVLYRESAAVLSDLMAGNLDADLDVEPSVWASPSTNSPEFTSRMTRNEKVGFLYTYIGWNLQNPIFADREVRRALAMLIPRVPIASHVHKGVAFPIDGPFYVNGPGYDKSVTPFDYDPVQAKWILSRAGWLDRDGDGILEKEIDGRIIPFEFSYAIHNARDYHQKIADIIKENMEQVGIRMTINKSDWSIFATIVRDKNFDAVRFAWGTTLEPDPFQIWHSSQIDNKGDNFVSYRNDRVDELAIKIRETLDPVQRWEMGREMHRIIHADQPYCFLFGFVENYFINRQLRGVRLYPDMYTMNFSEWYWNEIPPNRQ